MIARRANTVPQPRISPLAVIRIMSRWRAGQNTHEISKHEILHESDVADVIRAEREQRLGLRRTAG